MIPLREDRLVQREPTVLWRRSLDGVVVLGPDAGDPIRITWPGSEIWDLLSEPVSVEEVARLLVERYGGNLEDVRVDTGAVLDRLAEAGAVKVAGDPRRRSREAGTR